MKGKSKTNLSDNLYQISLLINHTFFLNFKYLDNDGCYLKPHTNIFEEEANIVRTELNATDNLKCEGNSDEKGWQ